MNSLKSDRAAERLCLRRPNLKLVKSMGSQLSPGGTLINGMIDLALVWGRLLSVSAIIM